VLSKLQKVSQLRLSYVTSLIVMPHYLHVSVMGVVDFLVSTFHKCFELSIYSNERRLINCVVYVFTAQKLIFFTDSAVAILPVSVRLTDKPVNRKFLVNQLTVNITSRWRKLIKDV